MCETANLQIDSIYTIVLVRCFSPELAVKDR